MTRAEKNAVRALVQSFVHDTVPEYIRDSAQYILSEGGVQKINLTKEGETWEVQATIQGEDFQVYTPSLRLNVTEHSTGHLCNCSEEFTGVCRHVAAAALKFQGDLREDDDVVEEAFHPHADWKQSFRAFFSTDVEPEPGRHYLIFRFHPEPGRLLVAFFRGRQNKSGLSSVHTEITLEHLLRNQEWCELSPQLPLVARQIGQHLDYYGH
ncbi:MAG: ATP-dependent helicase, partial [Desulfovibrionaceae bacterium]|nr:ATP-dependent helicase [Desulfovibrionaceae bacterium]